MFWVIVFLYFYCDFSSELLNNVGRVTGVAAKSKLKCSSLLSCLYLEYLVCQFVIPTVVIEPYSLNNLK